MHVSHHVVMRRVTTCAPLARTRAALRSSSTKPTAAYQTTAPLSRTWPPSAMASDTRSVPRHGCPKRTVRGGHILFLDPHVKAYCQGTPSVWCRVLGRIPAGGQWPYFMTGASRSIPTTKLHSRMLAAGAVVGAGQAIATYSSQGSPPSFHDMATCERPSSIDVLRSIHLTSEGPTVAPTVICSRRA